MKIKEIMTRDFRSIDPKDNVFDVLVQLFKTKISGLPIIDKQGKLMGMFTEKDALSYVLPSYIQKVGKFIYEENPKSIKKKFSELINIKVTEIMRKEVITTTEETTLCEAARIMMTERARRLPVVDLEGKVVGIVARCDILKALAKEAEMSLGR